MTDTPTLAQERHGPVLVLRLDRPERLNALTWEGIGELARLLEAAAVDDTVRAVILTGAGRAFCAGGDVKDQLQRTSWAIADRLVQSTPMVASIRAVDEFPKPLIAAINGHAAGAGIGLALMCDIRLAARSASFGFAFGRIGLGTDYGVGYLLPRVVGPGPAARLLFTAARFDADHALGVGLVDELIEDAVLLESAVALGEQIAAVSPFGVRLAKHALRRGRDVDFSTALQAEMWGQHLATATGDHRAAVEAFAERRPAPAFNGR